MARWALAPEEGDEEESSSSSSGEEEEEMEDDEVPVAESEEPPADEAPQGGSAGPGKPKARRINVKLQGGGEVCHVSAGARKGGRGCRCAGERPAADPPAPATRRCVAAPGTRLASSAACTTTAPASPAICAGNQGTRP